MQEANQWTPEGLNPGPADEPGARQLMGNAVRGPDDTMRVIETILACLDGSRRHAR